MTADSQDNEAVDNEDNEAVVRTKIVEQFSTRWGPEEAERRVKLLEESIPRIPEYAKLHNQRVDIKVHPEHLEHYIMYLQPRVRAILEHAGKGVIDRVCDSLSEDERLAKIIRLINLMDEKMADAKDADAAKDSD
jgi:hypothetical protein